MRQHSSSPARDAYWVHGRRFRLFLDEETIQSRIRDLGREIADKHRGAVPFFIGILNGAFMFTADLVRACDLECEVGFLRLSSYSGMSSSGKVQTLFGLDAEIKDRPVIVVEDIIDTGRTMAALLQDLLSHQPASLEVAALLSKPDAMEAPVAIDFLGFSVPNRFVVGYGMDYDGIARNLPSIYHLDEDPLTEIDFES
ncbi:MAG: hypoxanthine phosphoribosyltransferase [Haliscomenobacter sp.]|nr:hypoxanthine phosphoribosyltransferase [Haliscomenobacter sp.]